MPRDEDLDHLKAIRLLAFRAVEKPDHEYILRNICRWYSREFYTPLSEVEAIPLETLLTHYFEVRYEQMTDEEREDIRVFLCERREERLKREAEEEIKAVDDAAFEAMVREEAKAQEVKNAEERRKFPDRADDAPVVPVAIMGQNLPTTFAELNTKDTPLRPLPPDIKMTFVPESELDNLDEWDLLGPPKKDGK